jgi:hypothetical protein
MISGATNFIAAAGAISGCSTLATATIDGETTMTLSLVVTGCTMLVVGAMWVAGQNAKAKSDAARWRKQQQFNKAFLRCLLQLRADLAAGRTSGTPAAAPAAASAPESADELMDLLAEDPEEA